MVSRMADRRRWFRKSSSLQPLMLPGSPLFFPFFSYSPPYLYTDAPEISRNYKVGGPWHPRCGGPAEIQPCHQPGKSPTAMGFPATGTQAEAIGARTCSAPLLGPRSACAMQHWSTSRHIERPPVAEVPATTSDGGNVRRNDWQPISCKPLVGGPSLLNCPQLHTRYRPKDLNPCSNSGSRGLPRRPPRGGLLLGQPGWFLQALYPLALLGSEDPDDKRVGTYSAVPQVR